MHVHMHIHMNMNIYILIRVSMHKIVQGVHMVFSGGFADIEWKPREKRECRFVFIGRNLDKEALIQGFEECKAEEKLRFKIGDQVQANVGKGSWVNGVVLKHWDNGNPYFIELEDGDKVWGPIDDDRMVRSAKGGDCACAGACVRVYEKESARMRERQRAYPSSTTCMVSRAHVILYWRDRTFVWPRGCVRSAT